MKIKIEDFFKPVQVKDDFSKDDYEIVEAFINFAKSLSRLTYQSIYLIDYSKKSFLFVSDNPIFLCGSTPGEVMREGYYHYVNNVPESDLHLLKKINDVGFDFFGNLDAEDRLKYSISYDFHLNNQEISHC